MRGTPLHLSFDEARMHRLADVLNRGVAHDGAAARFRIHFEIADVGAEPRSRHRRIQRCTADDGSACVRHLGGELGDRERLA